MDVDAGDDADPLLSSLLDGRPASSSGSAATTPGRATAHTPTPLPTMPQMQSEPLQEQAQEQGQQAQAQEQPKKSKKDKSKKSKKKRLLVPGAGHDDSFLYTLRAADMAGHDEYDEIVLMDTLGAVVTEEVRVCGCLRRLCVSLPRGLNLPPSYQHIHETTGRSGPDAGPPLPRPRDALRRDRGARQGACVRAYLICWTLRTRQQAARGCIDRPLDSITPSPHAEEAQAQVLARGHPKDHVPVRIFHCLVNHSVAFHL
jgi:hypothetical protein